MTLLVPAEVSFGFYCAMFRFCLIDFIQSMALWSSMQIFDLCASFGFRESSILLEIVTYQIPKSLKTFFLKCVEATKHTSIANL